MSIIVLAIDSWIALLRGILFNGILTLRFGRWNDACNVDERPRTATGMLSMRCYDVVQKRICKGLAKAKLLSPFDKPGSWVDLSTRRHGSKINVKEERHHLERLYILFFWVFKDVTATTAVDECKFRRLRFVRILVARLDGDHVQLKVKVKHQELDLICVCKKFYQCFVISWFDFMIFYTLWILANTFCNN